MSKKLIASAIQTATEMSGVKANEVASHLLEHITSVLMSEGQFSLPGIGTLTMKQTKARTARNPKTGEKILVPAGRTVRFKMSGVLKENVNS